MRGVPCKGGWGGLGRMGGGDFIPLTSLNDFAARKAETESTLGVSAVALFKKNHKQCCRLHSQMPPPPPSFPAPPVQSGLTQTEAAGANTPIETPAKR